MEASSSRARPERLDRRAPPRAAAFNQSRARPSRLPSDHGGLFPGQVAAVPGTAGGPERARGDHRRGTWIGPRARGSARETGGAWLDPRRDGPRRCDFVSASAPVRAGARHVAHDARTTQVVNFPLNRRLPRDRTNALRRAGPRRQRPDAQARASLAALSPHGSAGRLERVGERTATLVRGRLRPPSPTALRNASKLLRPFRTGKLVVRRLACRRRPRTRASATIQWPRRRAGADSSSSPTTTRGARTPPPSALR